MKIVSLLPSATEIICQIGLGDCLVGVSHECDYPMFVRQLPVVTNSLIPKNVSSLEIDQAVREQLRTAQAIYHLDMMLLKQLKPDFIVTQSLCEVCAVTEDEVFDAVTQLPNHVQIINLEPMSLGDVFDTILLVGEETHFKKQATNAVTQLKQRVNKIIECTEKKIPAAARADVIFLEWLDPLFNAGHWTPELIEYAGGNSLLDNKNKPSKTIAWDSIVAVDPDVLLVACCGYDVQKTLADMPILSSKPQWASLKSVRHEKIYVVDGNAYFSRPGPRLVDGLEIIAHAMHPKIHELPNGLTPAVHYKGN